MGIKLDDTKPAWYEHMDLTPQQVRSILLLYLKDDLQTVPHQHIDQFKRVKWIHSVGEDIYLTCRGTAVAERLLLIEAAKQEVRRAWAI